MPISRRRTKTVQKQKLKDRAQQTFNHLLGMVLPAYVKAHPSVFVDSIHTQEEFVAQQGVLPMLVLWDQTMKNEKGEDYLQPQVAINDLALDLFLNKHVDPTDKIYGGVRDLVRHYLWVHMVGDDAASAHIMKYIAKEKGLKVEPAIIIDPLSQPTVSGDKTFVGMDTATLMPDFTSMVGAG